MQATKNAWTLCKIFTYGDPLEKFVRYRVPKAIRFFLQNYEARGGMGAGGEWAIGTARGEVRGGGWEPIR